MPRKSGHDHVPTTGKRKANCWEVFLNSLLEEPNVSRACERAGLLRIDVYDRKRTDKEFAAQWEANYAIGYDKAEEEAYRRAVDGRRVPVFYQGVEVGSVMEYSDSLLQFLLRGRKSQVFKERTENINTNYDGDLASRLEAAKRRRENGE